jgi:hypothetical protein
MQVKELICRKSMPANVQVKPFHRKPATEVLPTYVGKNQNPGPNLGQM